MGYGPSIMKRLELGGVHGRKNGQSWTFIHISEILRREASVAATQQAVPGRRRAGRRASAGSARRGAGGIGMSA